MFFQCSRRAVCDTMGFVTRQAHHKIFSVPLGWCSLSAIKLSVDNCVGDRRYAAVFDLFDAGCSFILRNRRENPSCLYHSNGDKYAEFTRGCVAWILPVFRFQVICCTPVGATSGVIRRVRSLCLCATTRVLCNPCAFEMAHRSVVGYVLL